MCDRLPVSRPHRNHGQPDRKLAEAVGHVDVLLCLGGSLQQSDMTSHHIAISQRAQPLEINLMVINASAALRSHSSASVTPCASAVPA